jgi:uncharacterized protein YndB with AHSA1/START domain
MGQWFTQVAARGLGVIIAASLAAPAAAEVTNVHPSGFVVRHETVIAADTKQVWLALISPDKWWRSEHTWSGDSANLSLTPRAGGCFCERIPEVDEPDRFTLEGSAEHMRIIQAYPERALRMRGGLGPLQSEPVNGVLTITISATPDGTRVVWEYNVAGFMRYEIPVISRAVDGVIGLQAGALVELLGPADIAELPQPAKDDDTGKAAALPAKPALPAKAPEPRVDDAFGDLLGE